eukprot:342694-Rhodomonas_salina.2
MSAKAFCECVKGGSLDTPLSAISTIFCVKYEKGQRGVSRHPAFLSPLSIPTEIRSIACQVSDPHLTSHHLAFIS